MRGLEEGPRTRSVDEDAMRVLFAGSNQLLTPEVARSLRTQSPRSELVSSDGLDDALMQLRTSKPDVVVVADDGTSLMQERFLKQVRLLAPNAVRIGTHSGRSFLDAPVLSTAHQVLSTPLK